MRAAIYVRVSTAAQAAEDKVSLSEQARELQELADARGWELVSPPRCCDGVPERVFGDPGVSGDAVDTRPGMLALLAAVRGGGVDAVLVRDTNRLARHELAAQQIHAVFEENGVRLVTPTMEYDYPNLQHRLMLGLLGSIEAYAKRWLVLNMRRARQAKAERGEWSQAVRLYGYRWDKQQKRPVPIPEEIGAVQEMYQLADEERMSAHEIAASLRKQGVPTRHPGAKWREVQVSKVLRTAVYKGEWETAPGVKAKDAPPGVVAADRWNRVQAVRAQHRKRTRRPVRRQFLLAQMIACGECGCAMTGRMPQSNYLYYACNRGQRARRPDACGNRRYLPADEIDRKVWALVEDLASDPEAVATYAERTEQQQLPKWREELRQTHTLLEAQQFESDRARIAYRRGVTSLDEFEREKQEIDAQRSELEGRAAQLSSLIGNEEARQAAVDYVAEITRELADRIGVLTFAERRSVLQRLAVHVRVFADWHAVIEWAGEAFQGASGSLALSQARS